jgi:hypothetical protein
VESPIATPPAGRAEIEVGYVDTRRRRQIVRATVRKGMVTKLVLEPCADQERIKITPDIARVLKEARRQIMGRGRRSPRFPMPLEQFMSDVGTALDETIICVHICIWHYCIDCCFYWYGSGEFEYGFCFTWINRSPSRQ